VGATKIAQKLVEEALKSYGVDGGVVDGWLRFAR
jgi:hypothetical protein